MDIQGDGAHFRNLKKLECSRMDSTKLCSGSGTTKKGKKDSTDWQESTVLKLSYYMAFFVVFLN